MGEVDVQNSPDRKWKIRKAQKKGNWFSAWGHNNCILIFLIVEILIESNVYIEQKGRVGKYLHSNNRSFNTWKFYTNIFFFRFFGQVNFFR